MSLLHERLDVYVVKKGSTANSNSNIKFDNNSMHTARAGTVVTKAVAVAVIAKAYRHSLCTYT